jgi:hypothetical protein
MMQSDPRHAGQRARIRWTPAVLIQIPGTPRDLGVSGDKDQVQFSIEDNGIGMDQERENVPYSFPQRRQEPASAFIANKIDRSWRQNHDSIGRGVGAVPGCLPRRARSISATCRGAPRFARLVYKSKG